jgi:hypothetical protein
MQSKFAHMQLNVQPANLPFYNDLFSRLGWKIMYSTKDMCAVSDTNGTSLWFLGIAKEVNNDYDGPGVNHLGIGVNAQEDVDTAANFLIERSVEQLFDTPRHRPDFSGDGPDTYYQVMFESPDRILFEIVYEGPKSA